VKKNIMDMMVKSMTDGVELAKNGDEAIELYKMRKNSNKPFDIVIIDLIVPGGTGEKETIQNLLEYGPQAKVLIASGSSNDPYVVNFRDYGFKGAIVRPYQIKELGTVIYDILGGSE
jgi:two-component system, cell cycle sensor histidine kinase and response regulator CckA